MDYTKLFDLEGKVALITGGSSGLGNYIAEGLYQNGVKIAILDINELSEGNRDYYFRHCDVSNSKEVASAVKTTIKDLGRINILINNAGIVKRCKAEEMSDEEWEIVNKVNLYGTFYLCREVGKHMIEHKSGAIVNIASQAGVIGIPRGNSNYCSSKGGVISLTKCLSVEWAKYNIRVNAISPCHFSTPDTVKIMENPDFAEDILKRIPLGRIGESQDIIGPVIFLASDASSMITGHNLMVDGGVTSSY